MFLVVQCKSALDMYTIITYNIGGTSSLICLNLHPNEFHIIQTKEGLYLLMSFAEHAKSFNDKQMRGFFIL